MNIRPPAKLADGRAGVYTVNTSMDKPASCAPHCPTRRPAGFTLTELLVVVAIILMMMSVAIPAFNAIRGGTDFTSVVYDVAGILDQSRAYAMANNTYVLVGI